MSLSEQFAVAFRQRLDAARRGPVRFWLLALPCYLLSGGSMRLHLVAAAVLILLATGCASSIRESFQKNGLARASREMECSREALTLVPREQALEDSARAGSLVGIEGCGQRVVYELTDAGWVEKPTRSSTRH